MLKSNSRKNTINCVCGFSGSTHAFCTFSLRCAKFRYTMIYPRNQCSRYQVLWIPESDGKKTTCTLVGGLEHFLFSHILGMSSSQLTNIFQRGSNHQPAHFFLFLIQVTQGMVSHVGHPASENGYLAAFRGDQPSQAAGFNTMTTALSKADKWRALMNSVWCTEFMYIYGFWQIHIYIYTYVYIYIYIQYIHIYIYSIYIYIYIHTVYTYIYIYTWFLIMMDAASSLCCFSSTRTEVAGIVAPSGAALALGAAELRRDAHGIHRAKCDQFLGLGCGCERLEDCLVVWLEHQFYFPIIIGLNFIIPIDFHSYFSEGWPNHQPEDISCVIILLDNGMM